MPDLIPQIRVTSNAQDGDPGPSPIASPVAENSHPIGATAEANLPEDSDLTGQSAEKKICRTFYGDTDLPLRVPCVLTS